MGGSMFTLEYEGSLFEVAFRKVESLRKPKPRLVQYYPKFKHLSNLYPVEDNGKTVYLFDDNKQGYIWEDINDPKAFKRIPSTEYLALKEVWHEQQQDRLRNKKTEAGE